MTTAHTLGLSEALRVAGIKGGVVPGIEESIQPVMILADFSKTYTAEPFEARAICADMVSWLGNGVKRFYFELLAVSHGGLVVEYLSALQQGTVTGGLLHYIDVADEPPGTPAKAAAKQRSIGGRDTVSLAYIGTSDALADGVGPIDISTFSQAALIGSRLYVGPGRRMIVTGEFAFLGGTAQGFVTCVWREIPHHLGEP